jgi:hypothetical protein
MNELCEWCWLLLRGGLQGDARIVAGGDQASQVLLCVSSVVAVGVL